MDILCGGKVKYKIFDRLFTDSTHFYSYNKNRSNAEIEHNRNRIKEYYCSNKLYTLDQVHGNCVVEIKGNEKEESEAIGDAIITTQPSIVIAIKTADCTPVFLTNEGVSIIGVVHCSTKSTRKNILEKAINRMNQISGKCSFVAVLGPAIQQKSYEVDEDFYQDIIIESEDNKELFDRAAQSKYLFDLPSYVVAKLKKLGVAIENVSHHDTCSMPEQYPSHRYSYKRGEQFQGSILSTIMIAE